MPRIASAMLLGVVAEVVWGGISLCQIGDTVGAGIAFTLAEVAFPLWYVSARIIWI